MNLRQREQEVARRERRMIMVESFVSGAAFSIAMAVIVFWFLSA